MTEKRSDVRIWADNIYRMVTILMAAGIMWIITTSNSAYNIAVKTSELMQQQNVTFEKALVGLQMQHSRDMTEIYRRLSEAESLRLIIARKYHTKLEVKDFVDRTIRPIYEKMDDQNKKLSKIEEHITEIVRLVKK